jgi:hypothetical protein
MTQRIDLQLFACLAALFAFAGCSKPVPIKDSAVTTTATNAVAKSVPDVVVTEESFRCIRDMKPVRGLFVANLIGDLEATVAVAESPAGKTFPPGTLIQVVPNSAMVKHRPGHSPETNDWEFFELDITASGAAIRGRGFAALNMRSGLNCFNCHEPAKANWDLICEQTHGCKPVPLTPAMLRAMQNTDPRCPKIQLPQEQIDALAVLASRRAAPPATRPP